MKNQFLFQKLVLTGIFTILLLFSHAQNSGGCVILDFNGGNENSQSNCGYSSDTWLNKYRTHGYWIPDQSTTIKTIRVNWIVCRDDNGQNGWQDVPEFHESVDVVFELINEKYSQSLPKGYNLGECEPDPPYTYL